MKESWNGTDCLGYNELCIKKTKQQQQQKKKTSSISCVF